MCLELLHCYYYAACIEGTKCIEMQPIATDVTHRVSGHCVCAVSHAYMAELIEMMIVIPVTGPGYPIAGKVTVGLASDWLHITRLSALSTKA